MKKRFLFVLLAVCLALPFAFILSACGKKENSVFVSRLEFKYNGEFNQWLNVEYEYGQIVDIFNGLEVWATYSNGSKKDITDKLKEENVKYYVFDEGQEREIDSIPRKPDVGSYGIKVKMNGQEIGVSIWIAPVENPDGISFVVGDDYRYKYNEQDVSVEMLLNNVPEDGNGFALYYLTAEDYAANCQGRSTEEKIAYLKEYVAATETSINNLSLDEREDGTYLTFTEGLNYGEYYFFLYYYSFGNYETSVTLPRAVTISKGDFILENANTGTYTAEYTFGTFELQSSVLLGDIDIEASDDIRFLGYPATNFGHFEFVNPTTQVTAANSGTYYQIKFVFSDAYDNYATNYNTATFNKYIQVTINKGVVERQRIAKTYLGENNKYAETYNGEEKNITSVLYSYDSEYINRFCTIANGSATDAGNYTFTLTLKNPSNYMWGDAADGEEYYYGELNGSVLSFDWKIEKANQDPGYYQSIHFVVNDEDTYSSEIDWAPGGEYTIRIIPGSIYPTSTTWTWTVYDRRDLDGTHDDSVASLASETTSGLDNTVTFTKPGYFEIVLTNTGDGNVNPLVADVYYAQIIVRQAELAHKTDIEADIAAVKAQSHVLTATNGQVLVPSGIIPSTTYAGEGSWKLWRYELGVEKVLTEGADSELTSVGEYTWYLSFVPTYPDCYCSIGDSFDVTVVSKDFENKDDIAAEVDRYEFYSNVGNFENVEVPDILPATSAYSALGEWTIYEGETRLYPGSGYNGVTEPCIKNWNLVFESSSNLYNNITVPVTVKFRGSVENFGEIYAEIIETSFEQELVGDSVVVTRESVLPVTTHSSLGSWKLFLNEEDYFIQDPGFSVTGVYEYLVRFVPDNDLYYGPASNITIRIYGKVDGYSSLAALVVTEREYRKESSSLSVNVSDLLPANDANGSWELYRESVKVTSAQVVFNNVGEFVCSAKYVPNDTNKYGPEVDITITVRANIDSYDAIAASASTSFGPYELVSNEYTLTYSTIIPTSYSGDGAWALLDSNHSPIVAASETFTAAGNYTYYVKFVPNNQYLDGPEVEVTVEIAEPAPLSTLSAEDIATLKNDLGMQPSDETAEIAFTDNGGSYVLSDLPIVTITGDAAGTLHLFYNDTTSDIEYEAGDELYEDPTTYTWHFVYDITDASYEDYIVNATATIQ